MQFASRLPSAGLAHYFCPPDPLLLRISYTRLSTLATRRAGAPRKPYETLGPYLCEKAKRELVSPTTSPNALVTYDGYVGGCNITENCFAIPSIDLWTTTRSTLGLRAFTAGGSTSLGRDSRIY